MRMKRTLTPKQKNDLWIKAKKKCEACGAKIEIPNHGDVGHKFAYSSGGSTKDHNLVMLCQICNRNQGKMRYENFLEKYAKIQPIKYKKTYINYMKEKKKTEVNKIKKQVQSVKIELHKTNSEAKKKTLNNKLDKFKKELLILDEKYKLVLGSKSTTKKKVTANKKMVPADKKKAAATKKMIAADKKKAVAAKKKIAADKKKAVAAKKKIAADKKKAVAAKKKAATDKKKSNAAKNKVGTGKKKTR